MECREAEKQITYFIQNELSDDDTEAFLNHIRSCDSCRREMETNYFIVEGLRMLNSGSEEFDVRGTMEHAVRQAYQRLRRRRLCLIVRDSVQTLVVLSVLVTVLLECRMLFWR